MGDGIVRRFEFHAEVLALHQLLTETWAKADPTSDVAKYPAGYSETFLDMARAVTQSGFHRSESAELVANHDREVAALALDHAASDVLRGKMPNEDDPESWVAWLRERAHITRHGFLQ
jgi:hypothetical protein